MIFRTCVAATAVVSLLFCGLASGATLSGSKPNTTYKTTSVITVAIAAGDTASEKACAAHNGTVFTGNAGNKICVLPDTAAGEGIRLAP